MNTCRICGHPLIVCVDFGRMPISNAFLTKEQLADEYFYHLRSAVCEACTTFQIVEVPDASRLYHHEYPYFASTSRFMVRHFATLAEDLIDRFLGDHPSFVVEIGSNDGIMLRNFARRGIAHLGVEPSGSVASVALANGVDVLVDFFNLETARRILRERGPARLCMATNSMHNIEDINSAMAGIALLLEADGVMVQEDPYLGNVINNVCYDQVYAEHMYLWSVTSLANAYRRHGLDIFDVEETPVHGGCMRYFVCHTGAYEHTPRLHAQRAREVALGLDQLSTYSRFRENCEQSRQRLLSLVHDLRLAGKRIVGYGATAKSTTVINYCGLGPDLIDFISDTTPAKQGKYSPGAHIPIVPHTEFQADYPDFALLFAWNHLPEIEAKERAFRDNKGKWIIPVRMVHVC